ncbi:unnamed protein product [Allacma fusca]|uniref:Deoxyuridine 5'-triphosphate nucleotidohydrolase n=1 Tax=Allacma fusca TaxID=39272 RepID=A0A8J2JI55_9HEXA|nr:unnamed protein product [Allacma fusca]
MKLKVVLVHLIARCPTRQYQASGFDLYFIENKMIPPGGRERVKTGIQIELPRGTYGQIRERSSVATRGLILNGGVIDNDFRGEIEVILKNDPYKSAHILVGARIGQLLVKPLAENLEVELVQINS